MYSLLQFVIQIVKAMNIELIHLYSILYRVCVFTVTVCCSVGQFVNEIVMVMIMALIYLYSIMYEFVYSLLQFVIQLACSLFIRKSCE